MRCHRLLASEYFSGIVLLICNSYETAIARAELITESKQFGGVTILECFGWQEREEGFWK